jgi:hypothetical protein
MAGISREAAIGAIIEEIRQKDEISQQNNHGSGEFLNAFSVNDPESTTVFLDRWRQETGMSEQMVLIFNTRADRPERTDTFIQWIRERRPLLSGVYITGDHRARAYARLKDLGPEIQISTLSTRQIKGLAQFLHDRHGERTPVVGIGNFGGIAYSLLKEFEP